MPQKQTTAPVAVIDHIAILVRDLDHSAHFYKEILGLEEVPCPLIHKPIRWFSLGKGLSIHVIEGDNSRIRHSRHHHIALQTDNFDAFLEQLKQHDIEYFDSKGNAGAINQRRDGYRQIFFRDPDGYWLELNDVEIEQ